MTMNINSSVHVGADTPVEVRRVAGQIGVTYGTFPNAATVYYRDEAAYLATYAAMQQFFIDENSAIAKVVL
jgi:hypothetical protein